MLTSTSNYTSIEWYDENGNYLGNSDTIVVYDAGIYSATSTDVNGCLSTCICTELIMVVPTSVDVPDTLICNNNSITVSLPTGLDGIWSNSSYGNSTVIDSSGVYWVDVQTGTCTFLDTFNVVLSTVIVPNISKYKVKCKHFFTVVSPEVGYTYEWFFNGSQFATGTTGMFDVAVHLPYNFFPHQFPFQLVVTDANGCTETITFYVKLKPCKFIIAWPVPFKNSITFDYYYPDVNELRIELVDIHSKLMKKLLLEGNEGSQEMEVSNLSPGVYFIKVYGDGEFVESIRVLKTD